MSAFLDFIRSAFHRIPRDVREADPVNVEKYDDLTPNMRALRLAMIVAEELLSMGVAASDVVHIALGITDRYCSRKVHIDVSYTIITISQDRGIDREPLTVVRTIVPGYMNYQMIQAYQDLAKSIRDNHLSLDDAENKLDQIAEHPRKYPNWVTYVAGGLLSAGVSVLFTGSWQIILLSLLVGTLISWMVAVLYRASLPVFFVQAIAAFVATSITVGLMWAVNHDHLKILTDINPTLVLIGGIVLLVAGMMIVGAIQDAIDEYYLTATARILKVMMMTSGIILGVSMGLYLAKKTGVNFVPSPERLTLTSATYQYVGAGIIAAMFALSNHARVLGILLSGSIGILSYFITLVALEFNFGLVASYGIAATFIGFTATLISRAWHIPTMATISAGIVPLVPGLTLYNGLMTIVLYAPGTGEFDSGMGLLLRAFLIAVSIAAGASFGNILGRPARRKLTQLHNRLPSLKRRTHSA